jgi:hypothetical protein
MGWRKIRKEDVRRGITVRITGMTDTAYSGATITGVEESGDVCGKTTLVHLSRPMVYAHEHFDTYKGGLIGCENFTIYLSHMCNENTDIEVYESDHYSNKGELRSMMT